MFLGLAYFTKIQTIFYVAAVPLLVALATRFDTTTSGLKAIPPVPPRFSYVASVAGVINLVIFVLLFILAAREPIPEGVATFADSYGLTKHATLMLIALVVLAILPVWLVRTQRSSAVAILACMLVDFLALGFLLSLLLSFLMFSNAETAFEYLLWNFKIAFLRITTLEFNPLLSIGAVLGFILYHPTLFVAQVVSLSLLALTLFKQTSRGISPELLVCIGLSGVVFLCVPLVLRPVSRDLLWVEILMNFLTMAYCGLILSRCTPNSRVQTWICYGLLIALTVTNLAHLRSIRAGTDANYNLYGWETEYWTILEKHGGHNRSLFQEILENHYELTEKGRLQVPSSVQRQAANHGADRRIVNFVFRNMDLTMRNIGVLCEGEPVWRNSPQFKIRLCPDFLKDCIVVDTEGVPVGNEGFLIRDLVIRPVEYLDKSARAPSQKALAILPRSDLRIFIFVEQKGVYAFVPPRERPDGISFPAVEISDGQGSSTLFGIELTHYTVLPLAEVVGKYFFVVVRPFGQCATRSDSTFQNDDCRTYTDAWQELETLPMRSPICEVAICLLRR